MKDIFCRIIDGEIPSAKVYEDEDVLAFLDISQVTKGHTLVIPKKHADNFLLCDEESMAKVMKVAQKIGKAQIETLGAKGVNILTNVGEVSGQSVMHFHVHVIPRYEGEKDGFKLVMQEADTSNVDLKSLAQKIGLAIK